MSIHVVRLGTERLEGEGLRIGTVRRPPRGVPKAQIAVRNFYDLWLPELAPSEALLKLGQSAEDEKHWKIFDRRYRAEMRQPEKMRLQDQATTLEELLHSDTTYAAGSRVLEAGCGAGAQTVILSAKNPQMLITSIDISEDSVRQARETKASAGIGNVTFQRAGQSLFPGR